MEQSHAREPCIVPPVDSAADAYGRNARHVRAVGERRAHDVELVFDAEESVGQRDDVPLALEFAAAEDGIRLRIEGFVEIAHTRTAGAGIAVAGISGELPENESVETRVVGGRLESERAVRASQADFDRLCGLDLEIWISLVESRCRVVRASGKKLRRLRCAFDILRGDAADEVPRKFLDQSDAGAH